MTGQRRSWGRTANRAVGELRSRVDGQTTDVAQHAATVLAFAVRLLRWPSLLLLVVPLPLELVTLVLALRADGVVRVVGLIAFVVLALVSLAFGARRHRILRAVDEPSALGTELGIAVSLSDRVDDARGVLAAITSGGGWRLLGRLRGLWRGVSMTGSWIEEVGDLPRARYFVPPKIGTTVTLTLAAAWLVPASVACAVLSVLGSIARVF